MPDVKLHLYGKSDPRPGRKMVALHEIRDLRPVRNGERLRRRNRFQFELLRELCHIRAARDDCLGAFVSFNLPHGQSDDKSRFTCL